MRTKWKDLTDAEKVARLAAGRRDPAELRAERLRDSELAREMFWVQRFPNYADLNQCCEAREIQP